MDLSGLLAPLAIVLTKSTPKLFQCKTTLSVPTPFKADTASVVYSHNPSGKPMHSSMSSTTDLHRMEMSPSRISHVGSSTSYCGRVKEEVDDTSHDHLVQKRAEHAVLILPPAGQHQKEGVNHLAGSHITRSSSASYGWASRNSQRT